MRRRQQKGFTLIELLVAVSLMIILMGAIVLIFSRSTQLFNLSEANMNIFQNARVAFDLMSKELASSRGNLQINPVTSLAQEQELLSFRSIVTFEGDSGPETGVANVSYRVIPLEGSENRRWILLRNFVVPAVGDPNLLDPSVEPDLANARANESDVLCQFIGAPRDGAAPGISFAFASYFDDTSAANEDRWEILTANNGNVDAVRISMDVTDEQSRITRTVGRVFWVANANN
ncbi:PilW family protein [Candidatus Uabimicrobium sp. HlEnr_7]|uniref:PilW family protein n=1 Tax=Candidatus Uabimicrobium helgolandensis TaxID=3095367 RepID=UPI003558CA87